jgi:outer membrane biosynthesis protein TonB
MNLNTLRLTALAAGSILLVSCGSTKPQKSSDTESKDLDSGPSRYLQGAPTQTKTLEPSNANPDPAAPAAPEAPTPAVNTPEAPKTPEPPQPEPPKTPEPPKAAAELPFGKPVPGKKGFVTSPYDGSAGIIDVRDIPPGTKVRDPYTGKVFRVP